MDSGRGGTIVNETGYEHPESRAPRAELGGQARIRSMPVQVVNVSERGVLVEAEVPFQHGSRVPVSLTMGRANLACRGEVVRCFVSGVSRDGARGGLLYRTGIAFNELASADRDALRALVRSVHASAGENAVMSGFGG